MSLVVPITLQVERLPVPAAVTEAQAASHMQHQIGGQAAAGVPVGMQVMVVTAVVTLEHMLVQMEPGVVEAVVLVARVRAWLTASVALEEVSGY
jgi:hypothetical protein